MQQQSGKPKGGDRKSRSHDATVIAPKLPDLGMKSLGVRPRTQRQKGKQKNRGGRARTRQLKLGDRVPLSLRVAVNVREKLDSAARDSGRSLLQEGEIRLEQSFRDQQRAELFSDLFFGRELSALLEIIGRAAHDAGIYAAHQTIGPGKPAPNWFDNPYAFDTAVRAINRVLEAIRPQGEIIPPKVNSRAEAMLGDAIANGLLSAVASDEAPADFMDEWADHIRPRLGRLRSRLRDFDYLLGANIAILPSENSPGVLLFDTDDLSLLDERQDQDDANFEGKTE
jgi:hypothetical protein